MSESTITIDEAEKLRQRLELLVRSLLRFKFSSAAELWRFQKSLVTVQADVQREISRMKTLPSTREHRVVVDHLRSTRWHARRLGDAFAWSLLNLDRQVIYPLGNNMPVPIPPDEHGQRGVEVISSVLAEQGWGFPLLHDVTDTLRIGDVTLVKPGQAPTTIEVKTRLVDAQPQDDGTTKYQYEVGVLTAAPIHDQFDTLNKQMPSTGEPPQGARSPAAHPRVERQLRRMGTAHAHQNAPVGLHEIDGQKVVTVTTTSTAACNSLALQRVVRRARRTGFGSESVDGAFVYAAMFDPDGTSIDRLDTTYERLVADLVASDIWFRGDERDRNGLLVCSVPDERGRGPQLHLPHYLLPLPTTSIIDMLQGRMLLFNLVNTGRLMAAIEDVGFEVIVPTGRNDLSNDSLVVRATTTVDNVDYAADFHNLGMHITEMIREFRPLSYIVDVVSAMQSGFEDTFGTVLEEMTTAV